MVREDVPVRTRNRLVTALLVIFTVPVGLVAVLRLIGFDGGWYYLLAALALTPYVAILGVVVGGLAVLLRRWWTGAVALLLAAALAVVVVPRAAVATVRDVHGRTLRVLASNLYLGQADPAAVVDLVRTNRIDVLSLVELTPPEVTRLDQAGLAAALPFRVVHAAAGAGGSGIFSRFPLTEEKLTELSTWQQPGARADLGGGQAIEVVAVHPVSPDISASQWAQDIKGLTPTDGDHGVRILAGDFNATLDHTAFRTVLSRGYRDAADDRGESLHPTWPADRVPLVTLDHVVVDNRAAVRDFRVFGVRGSDHDAVYAEVQLP